MTAVDKLIEEINEQCQSWADYGRQDKSDAGAVILEIIESHRQELEPVLRFRVEQSGTMFHSQDYAYVGYLLTEDDKPAHTRWGQPFRTIIADGNSIDEVKGILKEFAESLGLTPVFEEDTDGEK